LLRQTHPDTGGDAVRFVAVQHAWERIGTPEHRAAYDRHGTRSAQPQHSWAQPSSRPRQDSRPRARAYGHPGGWRRERYLALIREWVGRGVPLDDPYAPDLVRSAPKQIRHILADALAEEQTARNLADLGIGYTVWHDVSVGEPEDKIDHVVLGPTGLFAILSEDYGEPVTARRHELVGSAIGDERPMHSLAGRARRLARELRVRFTALVIVLPDDALDAPIIELGDSRGAATLAVRSSVLQSLLRNGVARETARGGNELFDVRTRLQGGIRFV